MLFYPVESGAGSDGGHSDEEVSEDDEHISTPDIKLESTDEAAVEWVKRAIKHYASSEWSYYSTLDIDAATDLATFSEIRAVCLHRFGLVAVQMGSKNNKPSLKLVGKSHKKARPWVIKRLKKRPKNWSLPDHWEEVDEISNGANFVSTHRVKKGTEEWQSVE